MSVRGPQTHEAGVRLGLVGCGPAGPQAMYAPILPLLEHGRVVALCDPDDKALDFMASRYGPFDCYHDLDTMLAAAEIDAVIVASPVFLHARHAAQCAGAGKHVLCEKPLAATMAECDAIAAAAASSAVLLMPAHVRRFDKSIELAGRLVREGRLGRLFHIDVETSWCHDLSPLGRNWRQSRLTLGGIFQDNGCHAIDLCRLWAGDIVSVSGEARILRADWEVDTCAWAVLRHRDGVVSTLAMSNMSQRPMVERYLLEGTEASLEIAFGPAAKYSSPEPFAITLWEGGKRSTDLTLYNLGNVDEEQRVHGMYRRQIDAFCAAILARDHPPVGAADGRAAVEAINALYVATAEGRSVTLPLAAQPDLAAALDGIGRIMH